MRPRQLFLGLAAAAVAIPMVRAGNAQAAASPPPAIKLAVSPARTELPVTRHRITITVYSGGAGTVRITPVVEALTQTSQGGYVPVSAPPQYGAAWLTLTPDTFTLSTNQARHVHVSIAVPAHQAGQRYLAILFTAVAGSASAHKGPGAIIRAGVASTLIIDVPRKVRHDRQLTLSAPGFSTGGAVPVTLNIANKGNFYALENGLRVTDGPAPIVAFNGQLVLLARVSRSRSSGPTRPCSASTASCAVPMAPRPPCGYSRCGRPSPP